MEDAMLRTLPASLALFASLGLGACDFGNNSSTADAGPTHNNQNGYCWERPTDCYDLIPMEEGKHYHCCFSKYGYYCDSSEVLHEIMCEYACTYDAENDEIYCSDLPDGGPCQGQSEY